jgi:hypothetical protein
MVLPALRLVGISLQSPTGMPLDRKRYTSPVHFFLAPDSPVAVGIQLEGFFEESQLPSVLGFVRILLD